MNNIEILEGMIIGAVQVKYKDVLPTLEELTAEADIIRNSCHSIYPVSPEEFDILIKRLRTSILISIGEVHTLRGIDTTHQSWYMECENDGFYWNRYAKYLVQKKKWSPEVVRRLDTTTNSIMDDLGNPQKQNKLFQRRGLLLGDVQSGKTATYTAICNKASDCGYRIIIVLAGLMENLRFQTQERLDAEFAGRESKYSLDAKADKELKNVPVGVGTIGPFDADKRIACFTSVSTDFNKVIVNSNDLTLKNVKGTALFVVKKNKSVLNNLQKWLLENNADLNNKIDLPLLLIDDEADNASVNTKSEDKDPTAINIAIRNILDSFYQASYLGITATPFANIFINPDTPDGKPDDLFPKHFLTVLPTPSHYIGADAIFGQVDEDDKTKRKNAAYFGSLIEISNDEMEDYFKFKHKKELADQLYDLPGSLYEAMYYFIIVNGIRDLRNDKTEHRSMMIHVSRFTKVQDRILELVKEWLDKVKSDIENYSMLDYDKTEKIRNIKNLHAVWEKYWCESKAGCNWKEFQKKYLIKAVNRIEVRAVNQNNGSSSLNYFAYKDIGMRVIAVGGNSLSRGLTLEGLCVSYFYRNTMMYDTLLQMGRWFGYRNNYEDLFRIWMGEDAIGWYSFITDAANELKMELRRMEKQNSTPEEFGLKVRQDPDTLLITAKNKMRTGTLMKMPVTVSGRLLETPRLKNKLETLKNNEKLCKDFIVEIDRSDETLIERQESPRAIVWKNVPKKSVVELIKNFVTHPWHLNFQSQALSEYIEKVAGLELWDVALPFGDEENEIYKLKGDKTEIEVRSELRTVVEDKKENMLRVNDTHVKVGSGTSTRIGLGEEEIRNIKNRIKNENEGKAPDDKEKINDKTYLIQGRKPILMIHVIQTKEKDDKHPLTGIPKFIFALGVGIPDSGKEEETALYVVNVNELKNWIDIEEYEDDEDDNI